MLNDIYETTKKHKNGKGGRENNMTSVNRRDFVERIELKLALMYRQVNLIGRMT